MTPKSEYDIHSIIRNYPYLLGDEFNNLKLRYERIYKDRTRADFVFMDDFCSIVVEVKKGPIDAEMLTQALRYLENERKENSTKLLKGILVGSRMQDGLKNELNKSEHSFEIRLLDIDVPTKIKICDKCRKANALSAVVCRYCSSGRFIVDPFLFWQGFF